MIILRLNPSLDVWYGEITYEYEYEDDECKNSVQHKVRTVNIKTGRKKIRFVIPNPA